MLYQEKFLFCRLLQSTDSGIDSQKFLPFTLRFSPVKAPLSCSAFSPSRLASPACGFRTKGTERKASQEEKRKHRGFRAASGRLRPRALPRTLGAVTGARSHRPHPPPGLQRPESERLTHAKGKGECRGRAGDPGGGDGGCQAKVCTRAPAKLRPRSPHSLACVRCWQDTCRPAGRALLVSDPRCPGTAVGTGCRRSDQPAGHASLAETRVQRPEPAQHGRGTRGCCAGS